MNVMEAILNRRSIRKYKTEPISDDVIQQVLNAARWAPSWANTQCARFVVIKDPTTKTRMVRYGSTPKIR